MADIDSIISASQQSASAASSSADSLIANLGNLAYRMQIYPGTLLGDITVPTDPRYEAKDTPGWLAASRTDAEIMGEAQKAGLDPSIPALPDPLTAPVWSATPPSPFAQAVPVLHLPTAPSLALPNPPPAVAIHPVTLPSLVRVDPILGTALFGVEALPPPDPIQIPAFSAPAPEVGFVVPPLSEVFTCTEVQYNSPLIDALAAYLQDEMGVGASGIEPNDELALWSRARDREAVAHQDSARAVAQHLAARGYRLPPGAMAAMLQQAAAEFNAGIATANREIALKRADLYAEARRFAVEQGIRLGTSLLTYHGAVMERLLNAAKIKGDFAIQVFAAACRQQETLLALWRAKAERWTLGIENALKATKSYELTLARAEAEDRRDGNRIALLNAMNQGVALADRIRQTRLEEARVLLDNERLKLEEGREGVAHFQALVQGAETSFRAYASQVQAESAKLEPYRLALDSYRAQMEAEKTRAEIDSLKAGVARSTLEANMKRHEAGVEVLKVQLAWLMKRAEVLAGLVGHDLTAWRNGIEADTKNEEADFRRRAEHARVQLDAYRAISEDALRIVTSNNAVTDFSARLAERGVSYYAQAASAALGQIHGAATMSPTT
jgi:hypothetical protein